MNWIIASGVYNLAFALFHLAFWRLLNWKEQLPRLSPTNRAVMQALNLCLTFFFFLGAYLYLGHTHEIRTSAIGETVSVGMLLFWVFRGAQQVLLFDLRQRIHQVLMGTFCLGVILHGGVVFL